MTLQQIFENSDYGKFREKELSQIEINEIADRLNQSKGIIWFKQYMKVRETLPNELLKPILKFNPKIQTGWGAGQPFCSSFF